MTLQTTTLEQAVIAAFAKQVPPDVDMPPEIAVLGKDLAAAIHAFVASGDVGGVQVTDPNGIVLSQTAVGKVT
ncbi:MAG: hypothetical protein H0V33_10325 [Acidimicrobiia bacterium]|jgi:hypothetical protein|nr:hypothetical protein [Acidimicrobiia bacterium]